MIRKHRLRRAKNGGGRPPRGGAPPSLEPQAGPSYIGAVHFAVQTSLLSPPPDPAGPPNVVRAFVPGQLVNLLNGSHRRWQARARWATTRRWRQATALSARLRYLQQHLDTVAEVLGRCPACAALVSLNDLVVANGRRPASPTTFSKPPERTPAGGLRYTTRCRESRPARSPALWTPVGARRPAMEP
jgi:hypothetical protein